MGQSNHKDYESVFEQMTFTYDKCFLCGVLLDDQNRSVEHVVPKWLQRKYNLWNKELILLNRTSIKYKDLTIPCCQACNNIMSNEVENPIRRATNLGYDEFAKMDERIIFLWLNKLSYGLLFKELSLRSQVSDVQSEPIYADEYLKEHKMQYLFLRSLISKTIFASNPWSILVFKINPDGEEPYWAGDNPFLKTFCIRMDNIGIIAHLMDNGFGKNIFMESPEMKELLRKTLHPIQFAELCAQFVYKSSLFYRDPFYTTFFNEDGSPHTVISHEISGEGYRDWVQEDYARGLTFFLNFWEVDFDDIYKGNGKVISFLRNEDRSFKDFFTDPHKQLS